MCSADSSREHMGLPWCASNGERRCIAPPFSIVLETKTSSRYCLLVPVFYWLSNKFKHLGERGWRSDSASVRSFPIARW